MRSADGFLCLYSITDKKSFLELEEFVTQILRVKDVDYFPMILVGNKADLESERMVSRQEALTFGKDKMQLNEEHQIIETSAKTRKNIDVAFAELVRLLRVFNAAKKYGKSKFGSFLLKKKRKLKCEIL